MKKKSNEIKNCGCEGCNECKGCGACDCGKSSSGLGATLLKILGFGAIIGAALIGGAEKLGEEVLHDEEYEESLVKEIKE